MAHLGTNAQPPGEYIEHALCDRYKWTLHYVRALPLPDVLKLMTIISAENKALKVMHG
jgi:hypothetical protein